MPNRVTKRLLDVTGPWSIDTIFGGKYSALRVRYAMLASVNVFVCIVWLEASTSHSIKQNLLEIIAIDSEFTTILTCFFYSEGNVFLSNNVVNFYLSTTVEI